MELICVIEGDQGAPIRMWKTVKKVDRKVVEDFVGRWADIFMPPSDFYPNFTDEDKTEIVNGLLNDGDSWWFDETWCFQIHRQETI